MAVLPDIANVSTQTFNSTTTSFTSTALTIGPNDNAVILALEAYTDNSSQFSSVVWNGTGTFVRLGGVQNADLTWTDFWVLVAGMTGFAAGSGTLKVTYPAALPGNSYITWIPLSGVNITIPPTTGNGGSAFGTVATASNSTGSPISVTGTGTTSANDIYVGLGQFNATSITQTNGSGTNLGKSTAAPVASASTDTMPGNASGVFTWTGSGGSNNNANGIAVAVFGFVPPLIGIGATASAFSTATVTPTLPVGYVAGQLLLMQVSAQMGALSGAPSIPGYVLKSPNVNETTTLLYARIATATSADQPTFGVSWSGSPGYFLACISAWSINPGSLSTLVSSSADFSAANLLSGIDYPALTVAQPNQLIICAGAKNTALATSTWNTPSGFTIAQSGIQPSNLAMVMNYQLQTSAANISSFLQTQVAGDSSAQNYASLTLAINTSAAILSSSAQGVASFTAQLVAPFLALFGGKASFGTAGLFESRGIAEAAITAALTNWATVTLTGPLYNGLGGALDGYLWTTPKPQIGTVLYYDATNITIATDGEISSTSDNCQAVIQFNDPSAGWTYAVVDIEPGEVSYALGESTLTATLSGAAQAMSATVAALAHLSDALSTTIKLASTSGGDATLSGVLTGGAQLIASAAALASMAPQLTTHIPLLIAAQALARVSDQLSTSFALATNAAAQASASGNLTSHIPLATSARAQASLTPSFSGAAAFTAAGHALAHLSDALSTLIPLAASPAGIAAFQGNMTTGAGRSLAAIGSALSSFRGTFSIGSGFKTAAQAQASMSAQLFYGINLNALFSGLATFDPPFIVTLQQLPTPVSVAHQIPGIYQPGAQPWGQFDVGVGEIDFFGIDWTYWLANKWQPGTVMAAAEIIRPYPWTGYDYVCVISGQTANLPPVWPTVLGGLVADGATIWQAQAVSANSLLTTVLAATYAAPTGVIAIPYMPSGQLTPVQIDLTGATKGQSYTVQCTAELANGSFLVGELVFDVS